VILALCAAFPIVAVAQNLTGEIDGVARDDSGAVVPAATVTLRNADENVVVRRMKTDGGGRFVLPALATGTYSVTVEAAGFKTTTTANVEVNVSQQTQVVVVLPVGVTSEVVTVSAEQIGVDTQSSAAGTLIKGNEIRSLSLSSRNYQQLLSIQPGISGDVPGTIDRGNVSSFGKTNAATFSVNGQQDQQNAYFLDGEDLLNHGGSYQTATFPNVDAIQEMNLIRNSYGAQYGGGGSAVVAMQSRYGGSSYHGGAWEFFRSQVLNANDYLSKIAGNPRPGIRYNDYGFNASGPVWIPHVVSRENPKTFFFFLQSFLRSENQTTATLANVPTAAERQGIFPYPVCIAYNGTTCATSSTTITNIDPTAQAYLNDIIDKVPLPNDPRNPNPLTNESLIASQRGFNNETQTVIRIDHQFGQKVTAFFRFLNDPFNLVVPYGLYGSSGMPGVKTAAVTDGGTDYLGHVTWTITPRTVLDGGYAASPLYITADPIGYEAKANAPDIHPTLPFPSLVDRVPNVTISGTAYTGGTGGPYDNRGNNIQVFANLTHTFGRHTLYVGENIEFESSGNNTQTNNAGTFTFTGAARPTGSSATAYEQSFAQFLEGRVSQFTQTSTNATFLVHTHVYEGYIQDDFRVSPRLTVNEGIRYTLIKQPTVGPLHGQSYPLVNFDPFLYSPSAAPTIDNTGAICTKAPCVGGKSPNTAYNPLNGLIISSQTSPYSDAVSTQSWKNLAPRFGFAYDVFGDGTTSLRGGGGIYFIQPFMNFTQNLPSNPPNLQITTNVNAPFASPGGQTLSNSPNAISANEIQWKQTYAETWSFDVQRQILKNSLLDVGYYGNRVVHLTGSEDMNEVPPGQYVTSGIITGNVIASSNQALLNQIRPYLGYGPINTITTNFSSNYNSLQSSFRKAWRDQSTVIVNYTWSKALANTRENYQSAPQSIYNLAQEYAPTNQQRKHIFSSAFVYYLPFFRTQKGVVGEVLGGWEASGIVSIASGRPFSAATTGVDPGGLGLLNTSSASVAYPDVVTDPNKGAPHTPAAWFNPNAFVLVPAGQYRPGDEQANDIVGPGYETWDITAIKNAKLPHEGNLQFRLEAFNAFNHTNYTTVNAALGNASYNQVTAAGSKRVVQLGLKLVY
jgi:hypothetical protein